MESEQNTKARIQAAAHRVFVRQGTFEARTQDIAHEAGVNKALLHYYSGSKLVQLMGSDIPLADKLHAAVDFKFGILEENPYLPGYLLSEIQSRQHSVRDIRSRHIPMDLFRDAILVRLWPIPSCAVLRQIESDFFYTTVNQMDKTGPDNRPYPVNP